MAAVAKHEWKSILFMIASVPDFQRSYSAPKEKAIERVSPSPRLTFVCRTP
jgi:hypothetical protein